MARASVLDVLYSQNRDASKFNFDAMTMPDMSNYLSYQDIEALYNIATSVRYAGNIKKKYSAIDAIMKNRGFKKFAGGTNRVVYSFIEDTSFLAKIAIDKIGIGDNPAEFQNQQLLRPFVAKMFQVSPGGVVGFSERIHPITSLEEFESIAEDVFDMIVFRILGKYIIDDIGSNYFMNWGIRKGFGPCLLDYPYLFELDYNKLICNKEIELGSHVRCGGDITYDEGFNNIICTKCGKIYNAKDLAAQKEQNLIITEGDKLMRVYGETEKGFFYPQASSDYIEKPLKLARNDATKTSNNELKVSGIVAMVPVEVAQAEGCNLGDPDVLKKFDWEEQFNVPHNQTPANDEKVDNVVNLSPEKIQVKEQEHRDSKENEANPTGFLAVDNANETIPEQITLEEPSPVVESTTDVPGTLEGVDPGTTCTEQGPVVPIKRGSSTPKKADYPAKKKPKEAEKASVVDMY